MSLDQLRRDAISGARSSAECAGTRHIMVAGHELHIFVESPPLIEAMIADIRAARQRVWLETYIFLNDAAGERVAAALRERAEAGLEVRVLYDAIGSSTTPGTFFAHMERAGVQVHAYHSLWEALWSFSFFRILNRRNHRKLLVIDDRVAYFGGMNLADVTHQSASEEVESLPASTGWRDVHIRLTGPQQWEVAESFERSWLRARHQRVPRRSRAYRRAALAAGEESIQFFDSGPGLKHTRASRVFTRVLAGSRHRIAMSMAYFLPVGRVLRELLRAHRRGVFLRVVVPGKSDVPIVQAATRHLYTRLLRRRFHIYERQRNMLHSKVLVADDQWSIVGSCNLDARSLLLNLEFLAIIHSRNLAAVFLEIIRYEMSQSRRIIYHECLSRPLWRRWLDRLAWSVRWWL
jgi:cardiolipin synthase